MVVAHLADMHLDGTALPRLRLEAVANRLRASSDGIDMIVVTGDLVEATESPDPASDYTLIDELLASIAPVVWCPGNSDDRVLMDRRGFSDVRVRT
ncbi:MAG: metallophosphoesterase [Microbacterium sp.]